MLDTFCVFLQAFSMFYFNNLNKHSGTEFKINSVTCWDVSEQRT